MPMQKPIPLAWALIPAIALSSCLKESSRKETGPPPVIAPELLTNRMDTGPQGLLVNRKDSPVRWQHWEPEVLNRAADARRPLLIFGGSARYPGCLESLDVIDRDAELVRRLNEEFVPVLADIDFSREIGLAAKVLSLDVGQSVSFPFILILSPEGHEVTWQFAGKASGAEFRNFLDGILQISSGMWKNNPDYISRNSRSDNENRKNRITSPDQVAAAGDRNEILIGATRQLISQYDTDIGTMSSVGGLMPLGVLQFLASISGDPAIPAELAARCDTAARTFGSVVLRSAMVDPLDGGVYTSRWGKSWDLPMPQRTCMHQARVARSLVSLHSVTGDPLPLEVALGAVRFAESRFATSDGLFSDQRQPAVIRIGDWLWTSPQIEEPLTEKEAALWKAICGIKELGNLPPEIDPKREFFRLNSLAARVSLASAAASAGIAEPEARSLMESGKEKLLEARRSRLPEPAAAARGRAAPSFRMISAYAALFTATGDASWRDKALALAKTAREAFSNGPLLIEEGPPPSLPEADARAFTYALAIQAALDLAEVTLDDAWRLWAGDLASVVAERFSGAENRLLEAHPDSTPLKLPLEDRLMLFDDSTSGLMRMNAARLEALGHTLPPEIAPLVNRLPPAEDFPVIFTDSLLAVSFGRSRVIVELPADPSPEWREAAAGLPLDRIARRLGNGETVKVQLPDGSTVTPATPAELPAAAGAARP